MLSQEQYEHLVEIIRGIDEIEPTFKRDEYRYWIIRTANTPQPPNTTAAEWNNIKEEHGFPYFFLYRKGAEGYLDIRLTTDKVIFESFKSGFEYSDYDSVIPVEVFQELYKNTDDRWVMRILRHYSTIRPHENNRGDNIVEKLLDEEEARTIDWF